MELIKSIISQQDIFYLKLWLMCWIFVISRPWKIYILIFATIKPLACICFQEKEGNTVDLSGGLFVRSLSQDPSCLPQGTNSHPSLTPQSTTGLVHNLDIGGQSLMISTGGATGLDFLSVQQPVSNHNSSPQSMPANAANTITVTNGASSQVSQDSSHSNTIEEDMNISPRPQQMDH